MAPLRKSEQRPDLAPTSNKKVWALKSDIVQPIRPYKGPLRVPVPMLNTQLLRCRRFFTHEADPVSHLCPPPPRLRGSATSRPFFGVLPIVTLGGNMGPPWWVHVRFTASAPTHLCLFIVSLLLSTLAANLPTLKEDNMKVSLMKSIFKKWFMRQYRYSIFFR